MKSFTYQQKIAIMRILLDIIHADGRIDSREVYYYNKLKDEFSLTDEAHSDVEKKNSLMALAQIKEFDEEQKVLFAELMANMIVVDEDIDANEVALYNVVKDFAQIPHPFDKTIKGAQG